MSSSDESSSEEIPDDPNGTLNLNIHLLGSTQKKSETCLTKFDSHTSIDQGSIEHHRSNPVEMDKSNTSVVFNRVKIPESKQQTSNATNLLSSLVYEPYDGLSSSVKLKEIKKEESKNFKQEANIRKPDSYSYRNATVVIDEKKNIFYTEEEMSFRVFNSINNYSNTDDSKLDNTLEEISIHREKGISGFEFNVDPLPEKTLPTVKNPSQSLGIRKFSGESEKSANIEDSKSVESSPRYSGLAKPESSAYIKVSESVESSPRSSSLVKLESSANIKDSESVENSPRYSGLAKPERSASIENSESVESSPRSSGLAKPERSAGIQNTESFGNSSRSTGTAKSKSLVALEDISKPHPKSSTAENQICSCGSRSTVTALKCRHFLCQTCEDSLIKAQDDEILTEVPHYPFSPHRILCPSCSRPISPSFLRKNALYSSLQSKSNRRFYDMVYERSFRCFYCKIVQPESMFDSDQLCKHSCKDCMINSILIGEKYCGYCGKGFILTIDFKAMKSICGSCKKEKLVFENRIIHLCQQHAHCSICTMQALRQKKCGECDSELSGDDWQKLASIIARAKKNKIIN